MKKLLVLFLLIFNLASSAQNELSDSIFFERNLEIINQCFSDLDVIEYLDTTLSEFSCSLGIMGVLESNHADSVFVGAVYKRLEELARKHFENGTSVFIVSNGMNSMNNAFELNQQNESLDTFYVSFGNSCISTELFENGVLRFNQTTTKLIEKKKTQPNN